MSERVALRRALRQRRRALPRQARQSLEAALARQLRRLFRARFASVGAYLPFDGEADITPLLRELAARGRTLSLPRLEGRRGHMCFVDWHPDDRLAGNRYRIAEPGVNARRRAARALDLVLVPLVAFDRAGTRLGMGAGYFDRHFAHLRYHKCWRRPRLVGVAFGFQEVQHLERAPWDVPLAAVVTESGIMRFD
ncbi:MAG: 5-formyltetrahydrofolate cyclo-ligase [Gammaproteobacteria bacterium]|nr:MAG: 5-formyltetrahydrofolate cyclo-ligase [Gammaproteobacteria bacterium]